MNWKSQGLIMLGLSSIIFLICIGLGSAILDIYRKGKLYTPETESCPTFPNINITQYNAKKIISSQYDWRYDYQEFDGSFEQVCLTLRHDVNVNINGQLVARSDEKVFTLVKLTNINDCHGNRIYTMQTGDIGQTIINGNRVVVSFILTDNDENILAYVDGTHFFEDNIDIKDINGQIVSHLTRYVEIPWRWTFSIYNDSHAGSDPRVLGIIAGKRSFDGQSTDICNGFVYGGGITIIVFVSLSLIGIILGLVLSGQQIRNICKKNQQNAVAIV